MRRIGLMALAAGGSVAALALALRRRTARRRRIPPPPPPGVGVREPRTPAPLAPAGTAFVDD
ncbi:MAG: hypothetical protein M3256_12125 [Actinomycetota bacterium]|nr:hypothetical protein [Actinomycetota bacterium]